MKTAILIDGGFYRKRVQHLLGNKSSSERAQELNNYCYKHISEKSGNKSDLYRIFYYDCPPIDKKIYHPYLQRHLDFSKSDQYQWMTSFLAELKRMRKFALRLGKLADTDAYYSINNDTIKELCKGSLTFDKLNEKNFTLQMNQKGVDMKIGLDIASLAYKKLVDQIILISGDSDFVPAAKLARREGIDFILDPLHAQIKEDLFEHIDGLKTYEF